MYGIYVRNTRGVRYADALVRGYKLAETRSRNVLGNLVGQRVAVIRTGGKTPVVIGYVTITHSTYIAQENFQYFRNEHLVPQGSKYDATKGGKWLYWCKDAEQCEPYALPEHTNHGRSYTEFEV